MLNIEHFTFNPFQTRCSIVWDETGACAIVDPGAYGAEETAELKGFIAAKSLKPVCILLTHCHFDHIFGVAEFARSYGVPVFMHEEEVYTIETTNPTVSRFYGLPLPDASFIKGEDGSFDNVTVGINKAARKEKVRKAIQESKRKARKAAARKSAKK